MDSELDQPLYSIGEVATLCGVNPVTLRAWQRRYGLVVPLRTPKGHRLYTQDHLDRVREILAWLDKGVAISKIKPLLSDSSARPEFGDEWQQLSSSLEQAVIRLDSDGLQRLLDDAQRLYPFGVLRRQLLQPWLRRLELLLAERQDGGLLGDWLEQELLRHCTLMQQHLPPKSPRLLLLATGPQPRWLVTLWRLTLNQSGFKVLFFALPDADTAQLALLQDRIACGHMLLLPGPYRQKVELASVLSLCQQMGMDCVSPEAIEEVTQLDEAEVEQWFGRLRAES
ncbi:MerR family transcriptional regulator [Shewanella cyperi]|uniref:MerR family transcriptional regulator n=1 Tax=Shewanella cyperi TaxID=2814292 RepID=A0A974XRQ7_9GAMM|nr:MerR family transcriptional regulator [Shewanella cyperi]QSX29274.1 MerR family transcriptional regulator [Shewanella cyperi]